MNSKLDSTFEDICDWERQTALLRSTLALLEWDQQTQLPAHGGAYRAEQITFLAGQIHRRDTDEQYGSWLDSVEDADDGQEGHEDRTATIRELRWAYEKKSKLPQTLVEALARASSVGQQVWGEARQQNDFARFAPQLDEILRLKRAEADAIGYVDQRYDALLDDYEPGASTANVASVLNDLKTDLVPLIQEIAGAKKHIPADVLKRNYPQRQQEKFCRLASKQIGFDYERGRLDVTHHPFCTELGPEDVRLTTRYDESFFSSAFFGTLHEAGHGIYEQGLRNEFYGLPPGQYCSLGIHESQSRLWENLVGRSGAFWDYFFPQAQEHFTTALADVGREDFVSAVNHVEPSLIRVEADEATYNLHIILRFELEQELMNDNLATADLPMAWNDKYNEYLGVVPDSDRNGVMQDVHWSAGLIGYFPTYSLGNLYASQFFDKAQQELGDLDAMFANGDFTPLREWLNKNVHQPGKCYRSEDLGRRVTGESLSHLPLMNHLRTKLAAIYAL